MNKNPCPRCGGPIPNAEHEGEYPGATSRWDNKTEICSKCGNEEGLIQFLAKDAGRNPSKAVHPTQGARLWDFIPDGAL